jgi:iron complex transport system ATP-binding protein
VSALLEGRGLGLRYGGFHALADIDVALAPGALVAVLGPNGAGKTSLLRLLAGTLRPTSGAAALGGRPIASLSRRAIARELAVVPQDVLVPFPFRVRELVAMGRAPYLGAFGREGPSDRARVDDALAHVGLLAFAERRFPTLSAGEKQRALLARALAQAPRALLLDEPTAHMDLGRAFETFELVRAWIAERGGERGALVVTHDLMLAGRFADRIVLLAGGAVAADGAPREALTPERIARVYGVEAEVSLDDAGRPRIVARRSRIDYIAAPDAANRPHACP